jgi:hypothetical protein
MATSEMSDAGIACTLPNGIGDMRSMPTRTEGMYFCQRVGRASVVMSTPLKSGNKGDVFVAPSNAEGKANTFNGSSNLSCRI